MTRRRGRVWIAAMAVAGAVAPGGARPAVAATGDVCPPVAGKAVVAVVVDFGSARPGGAQALCIAAARGDDAGSVLEERARLLGVPAPRYADSGLLCAIDGLPASGCGERTSSGYRYWSYWKGESGQWLYQTVGPADRRAGDGIVEGWRFQTGDGTGKDEPPRRSPAAPVLAVAQPRTTVGAPRQAARAGDGAGPGGVVAGVVVVALLGAAALLVARRRGDDRG